MVLKRIVINDENGEVFKPGDRIRDVFPGPDESSGMWITVDREVPDEPAYAPGTAGTATIENNYGVAIPDQAGTWVKRGNRVEFALHEVKGGRRAVYPANMVSDFVPALESSEEFMRVARLLTQAKADLTKANRQRDRADEALRALVKDLQILRNPNLRDQPMTTASGATMKRLLAKHGIQ